MGVLDHVGIGVADYARSKEFYEQALAPSLRRLLEFSVRRPGSARSDGGRLSFFIEAHGEPASARLLIAFGAESVSSSMPSMRPRSERAEPKTARPASAGTTTTNGGYVLDPYGNGWKQTATKRNCGPSGSRT